MKAFVALSMSLAIVLALGPPLRGEEPVVAGQNGVPAPKKTKTVLPEYPAEAQARGQRGIVIVELVIDAQGKVSSAQVVRSIPPFDEAALKAVQQWEYEVTRIDGRPVSVKLTVPITFAMRIPEIASRQEGIPELRAGAFPPLPADARESGTATAEVTLGSEGNVEELRIVEGPPAYADSLARALRTWRFAPDSSEATVTFQVHALFDPTAKGSKVEFRLDGLRRSESLAAPAVTASSEPAAVAPASAGPVAAPPAAVPSSPTVPATSAAGDQAKVAAPPVAATPKSVTAAPAPPPPAAASDSAPASARAVTPASAPVAVSAAAPPAAAPPSAPTPASPTTTPTTTPAARPAATPLTPAPASAKAPAVEVLSVAPPPEPPENGLSAIRDVTLTPGVPDLTRGRRPVPPPFARMAQAAGTIDVAFSVDAAGIASVKDSTGPEVFKRAAEQAVSSWTFRRTRADRIFLVAEFKYTTDMASATVRPDVR